MVPMLVVNQGEVAVIKAYVGLPTLDTSGAEFKFGSIVRPGHRGIWQEPLRTGKYPINPRVYAAEIVPTSILTLNWAERGVDRAQPRRAPVADRGEEPRGLRVPHRPPGADPRARHAGAEGHLDGRHDAEPRERGAAGRGRQPLPQHAAEPRSGALHRDPRRRCRRARTRRSPRTSPRTTSRRAASTSRTSSSRTSSCVVLTQREIANQEKATFAEQERAQMARVEMEKAKGTADMQAQLAAVGRRHRASRTTRRRPARRRRVVRPPTWSSPGGPRRPRPRRSVSPRRRPPRRSASPGPPASRRRRRRSGQTATALVAVANAVADGHITVVPEVLVTGGGGGALDGLAATLMRTLGTGNGSGATASKVPVGRAPARCSSPSRSKHDGRGARRP